MLLHETGDYAGARPLYERALRIREQAAGPIHPDVATILNNLAALFGMTGNYAETRPLYERALGIGRQTLGPTHPGSGAEPEQPGVLQRELPGTTRGRGRCTSERW